jgi:hypothetical protein
MGTRIAARLQFGVRAAKRPSGRSTWGSRRAGRASDASGGEAGIGQVMHDHDHLGVESDRIGTRARRPSQVAPERGVPQSFHLTRVLRVQARRLAVLSLDGLVHLLAVHADLDWSRDPQSDLVAPYVHHGDDDVVTDDDAFVAVAGQH